MKKLKSRPILPGSNIGVVAPGSPVHSETELEKALRHLTQRGYTLTLGETATPRPGYLAGADAVRQQDLEKMWLDENVAAIWSLRGGYGTLRLLDRLNYHSIFEIPKVLIGFSDITALELALWAELKLVTFHGPVLTHLESEFSQKAAWEMISGGIQPGDIIGPCVGQPSVISRGGSVEGILLGGNLTTICSMIGSGYLPEFKGTIMFLEEVGESAYRIDRMLTQLELNGAFNGINALIIGQCVPVEGETENDLLRVFEEKLRNLPCPVAYGFPIGHLLEQWTVPQGIRSEVDLDRGEIVVLESIVED